MKRELWKGKPVEVERDAKGRFVSWKKLTLKDLELGLEVEPEAEPLAEPIYRASFGISNAPLHGISGYGFLLQAWAFEGVLNASMAYLERLFIDLVKKTFHSRAYAKELMGIEEPSESMVEPAFNRTWEFRAEEKGLVTYTESGIF